MKKKTISSIIIGTQLLVASVFLVMLFSENKGQTKLAVVNNDNLNKMNDHVIELFESAEKETVEEPEAEVVVALQDTEEVKKQVEEAKVLEEAVDTSKFSQTVGSKFKVTTNNKTYTLTDLEIVELVAVVYGEAKKNSYDDALAVVSVILNKADRAGISPISVIEAKNQFSVYYRGTYLNYIENGALKSIVSSAARDAVANGLNGVRNNTFTGFNSWSSNCSDNYVVEGGNRYR